MPFRRHEVHPRVGRFDEQDGVLGRHEQPVHHLRQPLHRNFVVSVETIVRERIPVQGLHDTTLFPGCRNRIKHARVEPTGMLPGCEGHDMRGSIQSDPGRKIGKIIRFQRRSIFHRVDNHPLDVTFQHGIGRGTEHHVPGGENL